MVVIWGLSVAIVGVLAYCFGGAVFLVFVFLVGCCNMRLLVCSWLIAVSGIWAVSLVWVCASLGLVRHRFRGVRLLRLVCAFACCSAGWFCLVFVRGVAAG